jgi:hypothetical protein
MYNFTDTVTGEEFESIMKISERDDFLKENPHIHPMVTSAAIVSGVSIKNKVSDGFKEVLSKIGEAHPGSPIGHQYGDKSIKAVQTREVVRKHVEKVAKRVKR